MSINSEKLDKQHRYPWPVIETAVRYHLSQEYTYRNISDMMELSGVTVSHKTVFEWVHKFAENVELNKRRNSSLYSIEQSYVKCNNKWMFMYRAHDSKNRTLGVFLKESKSMASAKSYFKKTLEKIAN